VADTTKPNALSRYWREMSGELKKVNWPTRAETWQLTLIVIFVMVVMAVYLALVDNLGVYLIGFALGK